VSHSFSRMAATAHTQCLQVHEAAQCGWDGAAELVAVKKSEVAKRKARRRLSDAQFQTRGCNGARTGTTGS
jgi:hypothetical protein